MDKNISIRNIQSAAKRIPVGTIIISAVLLSGHVSRSTVFDTGTNRVLAVEDNSRPVYDWFTTNRTSESAGQISLYQQDAGMIPQYTVTNKMQKNMDKIDQIAALKDNWNGYGATAFSEALIQKVKRLISLAKVQPEVFPTASDSIQIEYDDTSGEGKEKKYLEIQVTERDDFDIYSFDPDKGEREFSLLGTADNLNKVVEEFYG